MFWKNLQKSQNIKKVNRLRPKLITTNYSLKNKILKQIMNLSENILLFILTFRIKYSGKIFQLKRNGFEDRVN